MKCLTLAGLLYLTSNVFGQTLFVSPNGKAEWSGKLSSPSGDGKDGPLPSVVAARDRIRELRKHGFTGLVSVVLREGTYTLNSTLVLTPEDSEEEYLAFKGEHPVISGGEVVPNWKKDPGPNIWTATLRNPTTQLFISGNRAQRSRLPVKGFYLSDGYSGKGTVFKFRGSDITPEWETKGVELVSLHNWSVARRPLQKVDPLSHSAEVSTPGNSPSVAKDARYWLENVPNPQAEGQWYWDKEKSTLSYWPLSGEDFASEEAYVPRLETLVSVQGNTAPVKDISFKGITFRHTTWSLPQSGFVDVQAAVAVPAAIIARRTKGLAIDHCSFSSLGGFAVWLGRGSIGNTITRSEIFDVGAGGIKVGELEFPTSESDQVGSNQLRDNEIHDIGAVFPSAAGIWVGWSGSNTISHNDIHDSYYTAISVGWTWGYGGTPCKQNVIDGNLVHEIGKGVMADVGGIYTLGPQPGTIIRNNVIHDVSAFDYGGWGIYTDEGSSNITIESNIVYRTSAGSIHENYGQNNNFRNNILAYGGEYQILLSKGEPHVSFNFEHNIVIYFGGRLAKGIFGSAQVTADQNLYWDERGSNFIQSPQWQAWKSSGHDTHSVIADPRFVDAASYDFRLRPDSPALGMGFEPLNTANVGPTTPPGALTYATK